MASIGKITRRAFLGVRRPSPAASRSATGSTASPIPTRWTGDLPPGEATFNPYVKIAPDNAVTVIAPRAEMGQGISTTLAALVAEELDVDLDRVTVEHGPADLAYYNSAMLAEGGPFAFYDDGLLAETMRGAMGTLGKVLGLQGTGGSSSTRDGFDKMRQAGAAARHVLVAAAAKRLGVPAGELRPRTAAIVHKASGQVADLWRGRDGRGKLAPPHESRCARRPTGRSSASRRCARHAGQGDRRADLRHRCRAARHAVRHGADEPALLFRHRAASICRKAERHARRGEDRAASTRPTATASA